MIKRQALGKGLSALIPEAVQGEPQEEQYFQCPLDAIHPNPLQPRQRLSDADLEDMAQSVREKGILTPLLVMRTEEGYQLIAGERRWRAAQKAGLERVPVVVREVSSEEVLELALIENIHRKDLNPIEEAMACRKLLEDGNLTQEELAKRIGIDRSTLANLVRLLGLPRSIQEDVMDGTLTMGHARVLAGLKTPVEQAALRDAVVKGALSVRQLEALASRRTRAPSEKAAEVEVYLTSLTERLKRSLGTKVEISRRGKRGRISLFFYSDEELERLLERLS